MGIHIFSANEITDVTIGANVRLKLAQAVSSGDFRYAYERNGSRVITSAEN